MSARRLLLVAGLEFRHNLKRPLFWILVFVLFLTAWGLSSGNLRITSGDSQVGGTKAWITSEFAVTQMLAFVVFLFYSFFLAVASGMAVIHDDELKVGPILHTTRLSPAEYIYGKFGAALAAFVVALALHLVFTAFFNHVVPNAKADEIRGPFALGHYVRPALFVALPLLYFLAATSFAMGVRARKPILVFFLPVALVLAAAFFLWDWSPSWLDPKLNRLLMVLDPAAVRWLTETWLKVDRGVEFYNKAPVGFDGTFVLNRVVLVALGTLALVGSERFFARGLRGERARRAGRRPAGEMSVEKAAPEAVELAPALNLGSRGRAIPFLAEIGHVLRVELRELAGQPGLYLFIPLILLQTIGTAMLAVGAFDTPLLATPGILATRTTNTMTLLTSLLLLFYMVESMEREKSTRLSPIYRATRIRTVSIMTGKVLANSLVGVVIVLATFIACLIVLLIQGKVPLDVRPFLIMWGGLLLPTLIVWAAFITFLHAATANRYTTYALGLAALILTGYLQMTGKMTWVGNWDTWSVIRWTDMGTFELDGPAILLNRIFVLALAVLFVALTLRIYPRRERDASRTGHRLRPAAVGGMVLRLLPFIVVPLLTGIALFVQVNQGFEGKPLEKKNKDYWRRNVATWTDADLPAMAGADVDLELDPPHRWFRTKGTYRLVNRLEKTLHQVPFTGGFHWEKISWTMNGREYTPDDRLHLFVFTPEKPLAPGDSLTIGFQLEGVFPRGVTKNGGGLDEFILPSGAVLTTFHPSFVPVLGYDPALGIDKENRFDSKEYPDDFYQGTTMAAFGSGEPYPVRVRITGPSDYAYNSVGAQIEDTVAGGKRTTVWQSDHPVNFFNVVAGKWATRRGEGTVINYYPGHPYNIDEMLEALDGARRYYSEWFMPYPWKELKLSEFPGLAGYAQGFPTNITFSENIGFLTRSDPRANAAFLVTAHESAHQWWGNMVVPGKGPGGDLLSEGTSHFSTILLFEQVKGLEQRIQFCKGIESRYGDRRQVDSERPLVKIDGTKDGDQTVTYDKAGWVFWMLLNEMGRERCLAGVRDFMARYSTGPDHPVLQDFVATLRPYAPDSAAYDAFVKQWFFSVVVPEYKLSDGHVTAGPDSSWTATVQLKNAGTGVMPVEVAAIRGERFPKKAAPPPDGGGKAGEAHAGVRPGGESDATASGHGKSPAEPYFEARTTVSLGPGESKEVRIRCSFKPEKMLVDPDALVLQLNRKLAVASLARTGSAVTQ